MSKKTETVRVSFYATSKNVEELKRIVDHHLDWLIDLDSNTDVISGIYGATVERCLNTKISYLYRDAGNNKRRSDIVIGGKMSKDQEKIIKSCLYDGEWFLPEPVGLPANDLADEYGYDEVLDHPWFEWVGFKIVDEAPTPGFKHFTVDELVQRFYDARNNWEQLQDVQGERYE